MTLVRRMKTKKKSIAEMFRKILLKINNFQAVKKRHFSTYKTKPVSVTMEMDRRNTMYLPVVLT